MDGWVPLPFSVLLFPKLSLPFVLSTMMSCFDVVSIMLWALFCARVFQSCAALHIPPRSDMVSHGHRRRARGPWGVLVVHGFCGLVQGGAWHTQPDSWGEAMVAWTGLLRKGACG
jgi:hypothetical protein